MKPTRLLVVACLLALSCGCGPSAKQRALNASLSGLNAARDGFVAYDEREQERIVEECQPLAEGATPVPGGCYTFEEGRKRLLEYRGERDKVVQVFVIAYSALAMAALNQSTANLMEVAKAAAEVYAAVKGLMGKNEPEPPPPGVAPATQPDAAPANP